MAYGNSTQRSGNTYGGNKAAAPAAKTESDTVQIPLYFTKPKREGTKLVASSIPQDKDLVITIPAGYSVKMFTKGGTSKNGKRLPDFDLVAQPAQVKSV